MMKKPISHSERDHYFHRDMIQNIRKAKNGVLPLKPKSLNEQTTKSYELPTEEEQVREQREFKNSVDSLVDFGEFKIFNSDVEWSGVLKRYDIQFVMRVNEVDGLFITTNLAQLSEEAIEILKKLKTYYNTWSQNWLEKIS